MMHTVSRFLLSILRFTRSWSPALRFTLALTAFLVVLVGLTMWAAQPVSAQSGGQNAPATKPTSADGAVIYATKCAACHGDRGAGDGPRAAVVEQQTGAPPPTFTDIDNLLAATPSGWFDVITNGRLERLMPPFGNSLSETERWNVLYYVWSLHVPTETMDQGQQLYADKCAACHGPDGQGKGPQAPASGMPDFTDLSVMAGKSQADLLKVLLTKDAAHDFTSLSPQEQRAVSEYVRSFTYTYSPPTAAPKPEPVEMDVSGQVINKTGGAQVPGDLPVNLYVLSQESQVTATLRLTETVDPAGNFHFAKVPVAPDQYLATAVTYQNVQYVSQFDQYSGAITATLPITIYESTTDPANLRVDRLNVYFGFSTPGKTRVEVGYLFTNLGDRTYVGPKPGTETSPVVSFQLPAGAEGLQFENGELGGRYLKTDDGFDDTSPIQPGNQSEGVHFLYDLPYSGDLVWSTPIMYPADAVNVVLEDKGVSLSSSQLTDRGTGSIKGNPHHFYSANDLPAGTTLRIHLSGPAQTTEILLGAGALALALGGVGYWFRRGRQQFAVAELAEEADPLREELIQEIADLDDEFEAGRIAEPAYRARRSALKARLLTLSK